jgi:quinol-cytochrome oxidoreductase complex cytochrome b subunit
MSLNSLIWANIVRLMKMKGEAKVKAMELSLRYGSVRRVSRLLEKQGLGDLLDQSELESIMIEAESIQSLIPDRPRRTWPRMVGIVAIIMGVAGIWGGMERPRLRRLSPAGCGIVAVILGAVLVLKPSASNTEI